MRYIIKDNLRGIYHSIPELFDITSGDEVVSHLQQAENTAVELKLASYEIMLESDYMNSDHYKSILSDQDTALLNSAIQGILDSKAREHGYDNIVSAVSYANSKNLTFNAEAIAFSDWRDSVWLIHNDSVGKLAQDVIVESLPAFVHPG